MSSSGISFASVGTVVRTHLKFYTGYLAQLLRQPAVVVLILCSTTSLYIWFYKPAVIVKAFLRIQMLRAGFTSRFLKTTRFGICYAERGHPSPHRPTIVMIHGFSMSKDTWAGVVLLMPPEVHVIALDIPGHGGSDTPEISADFHLVNMVQFLHEFFMDRGLSHGNVHLVGGSLGGVIALLYADLYPAHVKKLTLICTSTRSPTPTAFQRSIEQHKPGEKCILIPETIEELKYMLEKSMYKKVTYGKQILQGILDVRNEKREFFVEFFDSLQPMYSGQIGDELEERERHVKTPTQIIWGKQDEIIHVSAADKLRKTLPNCQRVDLLDNCGHSCNMDQTDLVAKYVLLFNLE